MTDSLRTLLMPHEAAGFLNREFGRDMLFVKGNAAKFQDLFSWQSLNRILAEHSLTPPRMYLSQRGRPAEDLGFSRTPDGSSVRRGTIPTLLDLGTLNSRMREGATLVINSIEQTSQPLTALCDGLADLFSTYPLVNAYVSSGAEDGFGLHWDDHEVFVLQIAGRKRWQIYHRSVEAPLIRTADAMRPPEKDEPVFDSLLEIGDLLYLPRGWWHAPRGIGEPSMHLTISLPVPTGLDVIDWMVSTVSSAATARKDLPLFGDAETRCAYGQALKEQFDKFWQDDPVSKFIEFRRSTLAARSRPSFPFSAMPEPLAQQADFCVRYSGIAFTVDNSSPNELRVSFAGTQCTVDAEMYPALMRLLSHEKVTFSKLLSVAPNVAPGVLKSLLGDLLVLGLIHLVEEQ
jgi:JmjC domain